MSGLIGLYNASGDKLSTDSLDLFGLKLHIPSPSYDLITENVDGVGGVTVLDEILQPRNLTAEFFSRSNDYVDSLKLRDELYRILSGGSVIYVTETYQPGKRWKVHVIGWSPDRIDTVVQRFDIPLIAPVGLAESANEIRRSFNTEAFTFTNKGNHKINMRTQTETEITFKGASNSLSIKNITTNEEWKYNGSTTAKDEIKLVGVRSLKNGQSIFGVTNKKLLSLAVGNNKFEVKGATGKFELTISTRFYFL